MSDQTSKVKELASEWDVEKFQFNQAAFAWLNEELLESILRRNLKEAKIQIEKIEKSQAVEKGENYGSVPAKVHVVYNTTQQLYLVVKCCHIDREAPLKIFAKENFFYDTIWPKLAKELNLYQDYENPEYFVPRHFSGGPSSAVIMSDVGVRGFRSVPRHRRLDFEHCKLVLERIARLHASSIKLREQEPELRGSLKNYYDTDSVTLSSTYRNGVLIMAKEILSWPGYEHYSPRLEELSKTIWEKVKRIRSSNGGRISVINHGDCWSNNMLFHYSNEKPDSLIMVDFQDVQWGSPAVDFLYFFFFSAQMDVLLNKFDELIKCYLKEIRNTLERLNLSLSLFPEEDFKADLNDGLIFGVVNSFTLQVMTQAPAGVQIDFSQVLNGEALKENSQWRAMLSHDNLREYVQKY